MSGVDEWGEQVADTEGGEAPPRTPQMLKPPLVAPRKVSHWNRKGEWVKVK